MKKRSKRYLRSLEKIQKASPNGEPLPMPDAVELLKKLDSTKFDETVELSFHLGIDPKQTNETIRGAFSLPHGLGKKVRIIVFAEGEPAQQAKEAGAMEVGGEELAKKILGGWLDFDIAIAHPSMMKHVGKLGRVLGPHGKMPTPKSGTVTDNIKQVVAEFAAGRVEYRNDDAGNLHTVVGKKSFTKERLLENVNAFIEHIKNLKPPSSKGQFIVKASISTAMGPGIPLKVS